MSRASGDHSLLSEPIRNTGEKEKHKPLSLGKLLKRSLLHDDWMVRSQNKRANVWVRNRKIFNKSYAHD